MSLNIGYDSRSDTFHDILITNLRCSFLFASLLILQSLNPKVNVAFILFVLYFLFNIEIINKILEKIYFISYTSNIDMDLSDKISTALNGVLDM
jgi:hypothetical protein